MSKKLRGVVPHEKNTKSGMGKDFVETGTFTNKSESGTTPDVTKQVAVDARIERKLRQSKDKQRRVRAKKLGAALKRALSEDINLLKDGGKVIKLPKSGSGEWKLPKDQIPQAQKELDEYLKERGENKASVTNISTKQRKNKDELGKSMVQTDFIKDLYDKYLHVAQSNDLPFELDQRTIAAMDKSTIKIGNSSIVHRSMGAEGITDVELNNGASEIEKSIVTDLANEIEAFYSTDFAEKYLNRTPDVLHKGNYNATVSGHKKAVSKKKNALKRKLDISKKRDKTKTSLVSLKRILKPK